MHNSDTGLQGSSPRDARLRKFVADGPRWAGYKLDVDPEVDGDEAAQFLAHADKARVEEADLRVSTRHSRELSLEAIEGLGVEISDPDTLEAVEAFEDWEEIRDLPPLLVAMFDESDEEEIEDDGYPDEEDERPRVIAALDPKYLVERKEGVIETFGVVTVGGRRQGSPRFNTAAICRQAVEAARLVSDAIVAAERKAAEVKKAAAKPEPPKGNGNGRKPTTPPVGKFLTGVVIDQGHKGLLVDIGNGLEARVPIADEYGHGSWQAAAAWLHSHTIGTKVRVKVVRVLMNGHAVIEAVLSDRHPRPWWRKKEANEQIEAPAAN